MVIWHLLGHRANATWRLGFVRGNRRVDQVIGGNREVEETPRPLLARERAGYLQLAFAEHIWNQDG